MNTNRYLIVNADDFGMSEGVTRGILEAHQHGVVSSTSALVTTGAAEASIQQAQRDAPALGVGLHLNLTFGQPVLNAREVPSLVKRNGDFTNVSWGISLTQHWHKRDIKAEFNAQLERFITYAGELPDHLDTHQLVGSLSPACRETMLDIAEQHGLPVRQGGRSLFQQFEREVTRWSVVTKTLAPPLFRRYPFKRHRHIYERSPLSPDYFEYGFHAEKATLENLLDILEDLPEGVVELVCHPGYAGAGADGYALREQELAVLTDQRVREKVRAVATLSTFDILRQPN